MDGGFTMSQVPAHIIDKIKKRREQERPRPFLELPIPEPPPPEPEPEDKKDKDSGVVIIDLIIDQGQMWDIVEMTPC